MYDKEVSKKQIARELMMPKNIVKRLLEIKPVYRREQSPTKADDYKDLIRLWYLDGEYATYKINDREKESEGRFE